MEEKKLTLEEALNNIGIALGHETLRLSQGEHITLINSFNVLKDLVKQQELKDK